MKIHARGICSLLSATILFAYSPGWAAVITVDGFDSTVADDGICTLREAITAATTDTASGATPGECPAGSGADTVTLTGDVTLDLVDNAAGGSNGLPSVTSSIVIEGNGHTIARDLTAPDFRIFHVGGPLGTLTLDGVTVSNGRDPGGFAGLLNNAGTVTITNSTLSGNDGPALGDGFAVANDSGTVTITSSTLSGNETAALNDGGGAMTITNSTISGNFGGTSNASGTLAITNSTLSGNFIGIVLGDTITVTNSLLASSSLNCLSDGAPVTDGGGNLANDSSCGTIPATLTGLNPVLADNGGPTRTHALLAGSNAIDGAGACGLGTDQRGETRPQGFSCDIGAYEFACGNGVLDLAEECDDSNWVDGDGCDSNCTLTACGNSIITAGEQCDDSNTDDGDCCSSTCQFQDALGVGGSPNCCAAGTCQVSVGCGLFCFTPGAICKQDGGPGTACTCELP